MSERSFSQFLEESLRTLEAELPRASRMLAESLGRRRIEVLVDGDRCVVTTRGHRLAVLRVPIAPTSPGAIVLETRRDVIVALLEGLDLVDAVLSDGLNLKGSVDDIAALETCLLIYVRGAVRCPSFPELLNTYLSARRDKHASRDANRQRQQQAHTES